MESNQIDQQLEMPALKNSPVHDLRPLYEEPQLLNIDDIDLDETNPGSVTESLRYQRRAPSMRDSYDIFGRIVYPIIVCKNAEHKGRYIHVDGFGRLEQLKQRGEKKIRAYVYPPMTLEQRICFRQTLNAAQEPFDAVSIINDLRNLAEERKLDLNNVDNVETLVRDLPEKVQRHKKDILELSRWHPEAIAALGESYGSNPKAIGIDQVRSLGKIINEMLSRHQKTLKKLGGTQETSKLLAKMYLERKFAERGRSQDGIRVVTRCLKLLPDDDPTIYKFFNNGVTIEELEKSTKEKIPNDQELVINACTEFINVLLSLNTKLLTAEDRNALKRTALVLNGVLSEGVA
jgi:ParB-like chromosome segregation protein Spo0J